MAVVQEREAKKRAALQATSATGGKAARDADGGGDAARKKARGAPKAPVLSFDADEGEEGDEDDR